MNTGNGRLTERLTVSHYLLKLTESWKHYHHNENPSSQVNIRFSEYILQFWIRSLQ